MKDSGFFVDSCMMMAPAVKNRPSGSGHSIVGNDLMADSRCRGGNGQLVRYELGLLYETTGARDRALSMYQPSGLS